MDDYPSSLRRYWMEEEEDDDIHLLLDDDEAEVATYNYLVQAESSCTRCPSAAPPKVNRPRDLPSGHKRIKSDYFVANRVYNDTQFRGRFRMRRHLFKPSKGAVKNKAAAAEAVVSEIQVREPREAEERGAYLAAEAGAAGVSERVAEPELGYVARGVVTDNAAPPAAVQEQARRPRGERAVRVVGEAALEVEERGALARDAAAGARAECGQQRQEEDRRAHG